MPGVASVYMACCVQEECYIALGKTCLFCLPLNGSYQTPKPTTSWFTERPAPSEMYCPTSCAFLATMQTAWACAFRRAAYCPAAKCGAHRRVYDGQRVNCQLVCDDHIHPLLSDGAGCVDEAVHCGWPAEVEGCIAGELLASACVGCDGQELLQGTDCTTAAVAAGRSCRLDRQARWSQAARHLLHCGWQAVGDEGVLVDGGV